MAPLPAKATDDGSEPGDRTEALRPDEPARRRVQRGRECPGDGLARVDEDRPGASVTADGLPSTATVPSAAMPLQTPAFSAPCTSCPPLFQKTSISPLEALTDGLAASADVVSC